MRKSWFVTIYYKSEISQKYILATVPVKFLYNTRCGMQTQKQRRVADYLPRKFVTPITGALSLVIGISGVMLFFISEKGWQRIYMNG